MTEPTSRQDSSKRDRRGTFPHLVAGYPPSVCFSAEADLVGGTLITAIGIDAVRHTTGRRELVGLAAIPLVLGVHQLTETFVWWGLQGHVSTTVGDAAMWIYLLVAFVLLPSYVPAAVYAAATPGAKRRVLLAFIGIGVVVSVSLLAAMVRGPVDAELRSWHLSYSTDLTAGLLIVSAYVVATCGPLLLSGIRALVWFGVINLVAVVALAALVINGFASLWCAWAAVTSALLALALRRSAGREAADRTTPQRVADVH